MKHPCRPRLLPLFALTALILAACRGPARAAGKLPAPRLDLEADVSGAAGATRSLVVAGGCFWCVEAVFEPLRGVSEVVSGYAGGSAETARYETVGAGRTGHAEAVRITYDPRVVSYGTLLRVFLSLHDPTTRDRQGPDRGRQYRSAIFYANEAEKRVAEAYLRQLEEAGAFEAPIVTTLEPLAPGRGFYPAEGYHQDYARRHPRDGYVRMWSLPKQEKLRRLFPELLRPEAGGGEGR